MLWQMDESTAANVLISEYFGVYKSQAEVGSDQLHSPENFYGDSNHLWSQSSSSIIICQQVASFWVWVNLWFFRKIMFHRKKKNPQIGEPANTKSQISETSLYFIFQTFLNFYSNLGSKTISWRLIQKWKRFTSNARCMILSRLKNTI